MWLYKPFQAFVAVSTRLRGALFLELVTKRGILEGKGVSLWTVNDNTSLIAFE